MKKLSLFLSAMLISIMSFAGTVTFDVAADKTEVTTAAELTLTKDGVSLYTSKGVLGNGTEYRFYKSQWIDISCEYGNITSIEFTCTKEGTNQYGPGCFEYRGTAGTYSYEGFVGTWTGNEEKVTLYAALNQVRATKIVVTYASSDANFVSQPMITGDINFADTANVVITADEGMKIYYTLDGTDPTTASTEYTAPFEVYATTTVKAIAYNEAIATSSLVTTTVFTKATKVPCAQAAAIAQALSNNTETTELYYSVKGYVTSIKDTLNTSTSVQQFWIADTRTGGEVLYSYNNQVPCAMEVGMKVRIVGKLKQWNTGQYIQPQIVNAKITVLAPAPKVYTVSATAENGTVEGAGQYEEGTQATLTATVAEGYEFVNWTVEGTEVSAENPYKFTVTADVALVANFKEAAAVTTKKETSTCPAGTLVDGKVIHELECCTIVQEKGEATKDLKAASPWILPLKSIMTITPKPGVAIEEFIITCTSTTLGNYLRDCTVTNATAEGSNNPVVYKVINPTEPVVFTIAKAEQKFKQIDFTYTITGGTTDPEPVKYTVTVKAENGTVEGAGEYEEGAEATLTATANEGYEFVNWTVDGTEVSTKNPYTFNVTADVEVVANFKETVVQTTKEEKSACPAGTLVDGKVIHDLESCTIVQEQGTATSALTAKSPWAAPAGSLMTITPKEGVTLQQLVVNIGNTTYATWFSSATLTNATMTKSNNIFTITVTDGTAPVVINFVKASQFKELTITYTVAGATEPVKYTVTVSAENGTVEGAGEYEEGTEATLTATANEGYKFVKWTVDGTEVSTANPYKFTVTADVEIVAHFINDGTTTGVDNTTVVEQPMKIVRNGQVFILKGNKMFNIIGQQVK